MCLMSAVGRMDDVCMNHYERQLYTVFKTFDVDNEEALDKSAVLELCNSLQLEERGRTLVDTLFDRRSDRITFAQFRNGLLTVLGGGDSATAAPLNSSFSQSAHSDDDSSGREVAPKFVVGSKKYGRRSRPQRATSEEEQPSSRISPRASSDSRLDADVKREKQRMKCKRSISLMENNKRDTSSCLKNGVETNLDHGRHINCEEALALCHSLHMDGIDQRIVEGIFENSPPNGTTVGEFFDQLNSSLSTSMDLGATCDGGPSTSHNDTKHLFENEMLNVIERTVIVEMWERAGVQHAAQLLTELGFTGTTVNTSDLGNALSEEICAFSTPVDDQHDAHTFLLLANLSLNQFQVKHARQLIEVVIAERDKLRFDLAEANRRSQILAQDVDESHARIETELKARLKQMELRHTETSRATAAEWSKEREIAASVRVKLEEDIAHHLEVEGKLKNDIRLLHNQNEELTLRSCSAEEHLARLQRENARLTAELKNLQERMGSSIDREQSSASELPKIMEELQLENKVLRDRNDELCAALEVSVRRGGGGLKGGGACGAASWHDEAVGASPDSNVRLAAEEYDSSLTSMDQKVLGQLEVVSNLQKIFESIKKVQPTSKDGCEACIDLQEIIAKIQDKVQELSEKVITVDGSDSKTEFTCELATQTDSDERAASSCRRCLDSDQKHTDETRRLNNLIRELEVSLEQMKAEYEKCEEYWSTKLREERDLFAEEQRLGDERLSDLIGKIGEYERQFAGSSALAPIDERHSLEAQFNDLEDEFAHYKRLKQAELDRSAAEVARLAAKVEALERRNAEPPSHKRRSKHARDYHNPAFMKRGGDARSASDGERDAPAPNPIRRPASAGALAPGAGCARGSAGVRGGGCGRCAMAAREAGGLRARMAAAEGAVAQLHARLAAADVLVKELYLENCQLAHRRCPL